MALTGGGVIVDDSDDDGDDYDDAIPLQAWTDPRTPGG